MSEDVVQDFNNSGALDREDVEQYVRDVKGVQQQGTNMFPWWMAPLVPSMFTAGLVASRGDSDAFNSRVDAVMAQIGIDQQQSGEGDSAESRLAAARAMDAAAAEEDQGPGPNPLLAFDELWAAGQIEPEGVQVVGKDGIPRIEYRIPDHRAEAGYRIARYSKTDPTNTLNMLSENPQALAEIRRKAWLANYYGSDGRPLTWTGPASSEDVALLGQIMKDADYAGMDYQDYLTERASVGEKYGRPITYKELAELSNDTIAALEDFSLSNGVDLSDDFMAQAQQRVVDGQTTIEEIRQGLVDTHLKVMYPGFADYFDQGYSVSDISKPYTQAASMLLEEQVDFTDPLVQSALQGKQGEQTPYWEFKEQVKSDPRWQFTDNAYDEIGDAMRGAMSAMGLG